MTWLQPWAWLGLGALVVPIVIHLFSRRPARTEPFPSLRFLTATELRPTRRTRLSDWPLLLVRLAILTAAVIALAQPTRRAALSAGDGVASRIRVVDTLSAPASAAPRDSVETIATASLPEGLARAVARLRALPAPRALEVISTFADGVADSALLIALPSDVRVVLVPTVVSSGARIGASAVRTDTIVWTTPLGPEETAAVIRAVAQLGGAPVRVRAGDGSRTSTFEIGVLAASERANVLRRVAEDPALRALRTANDRIDASVRGNAVTLRVENARSDLALSLIMALGGQDAARGALPAREAATLARWASLGTGTPIGAGAVATDVHRVATDARWLWLVVLLLLGVEWLMRRGPRRDAAEAA